MSKSISELKAEYISYFEDVPIQKYAAQAVGRDEDTIIRWRKEDPGFADAVKVSQAKWIRKKLLATKAEFALERLEKDIFSPKSKMEFITTPSIEIDPELSARFTEFLREYTKQS